MPSSERGKAVSVLAMNTLGFTACFAVWMMYGVMITYFVDNKIFTFDKAEMGWLIGIPVLTGSILRLPVGVLTDRFGGRAVFPLVMIFSAVAAFATSFANSFWSFFACGLGFGVAGASFAVGVAYTSLWFPKEQQGTALGIFGVGNTGAALTSLFAPQLLGMLTGNGAHPERWRMLPRLYAALLLVATIVFWLFTYSRRAEEGHQKTLSQRLQPLKVVRVWRFGLYYLLVFGGFVALSQWLIPYYVNAYFVSVATAGVLAAAFSLPSGLFRALGGWLSDRFGARKIMYGVLLGCVACSLLLAVPRMDIFAPGEGIMSQAAGVVTQVTRETIQVGPNGYRLKQRPFEETASDSKTIIWPKRSFWQEPVVRPGERVVKRQLLARGVTHIYFQANRGIFTGLAFLMAVCMGIGMAAVYKHIPSYFPRDVGVVGGIVGVLGGLGGFFLPIVFGYILQATGIWTTCWILFFLLSVVSLVWMHFVVQRLMAEHAPAVARDMEEQPVIAREMEHLAEELHELASKMRRSDAASSS